MDDNANLNNDDLLNSSMFSGGESAGGQADSMFSSATEAKEESIEQVPAPNLETPKEDSVSLSNTMVDEVENVENVGKEALEVVDDNDDDDSDEAPSDVVTVRPVKFKKFEATPPIRTIKKNLDIMQDISMHISVELGRTKLSIKEVMDLEKGSIVELNKIAGEQVEVFVNGKLVAKGEVIVIEDRFGVRITSTNIGKNPANP